MTDTKRISQELDEEIKVSLPEDTFPTVTISQETMSNNAECHPANPATSIPTSPVLRSVPLPDLPAIPIPLVPVDSFRPPPNPSIPQDLSLIMEMVASHKVVGSLPPLAMNAGEKRRLVEQSIQERKDQGKGKVENLNEGEKEVDDDSSYSDSSSDETDEDGLENLKNEMGGGMIQEKAPTEEDHFAMKAELEAFMRGPPGDEQVWEEGYITEDSDEEGEEEEDMNVEDRMMDETRRNRKEEMEDDDDEIGTVSGPILSTHEVPLPPVALPPLGRLPVEEGVSLAGDVVSWMRDKRVEAWLEKEKEREGVEAGKEAEGESKVGEGDTTHDGTEDARKVTTEEMSALNEEYPQKAEGTVTSASAESQTAKKPSTESKPPAPRFTSAGTLVVRAMQSRPGAVDEGWLEEGSVVCWEDGRVIGAISETFGPLTSPFYQIRLPPPPFPYPSLESLKSGTKLYYPTNSRYRSFVNIHQLRTDPRYKGSDASNIYDEEVGEDEREWSDDEAEAEAKRRRKNKRSGGNGSRAGSSTPQSVVGGLKGIAGLPERPHFDYSPSTSSVMGSENGSVIGEDDGLNYDGFSGEGFEYDGSSDIGSTTSSRGRAMPKPYDLDGVMMNGSDGGLNGSSEKRGGRGRGGDRGRGGGGGGGRGRGGNRGRGDRRNSKQSQSPQQNRLTFTLPPNPTLTYPPPPQSPYLQQFSGPGVHPPNPVYQQYSNSFTPQQYPAYQQPPLQYPYQPSQIVNGRGDGYNPTQPSTGFGMDNQYHPNPGYQAQQSSDQYYQPPSQLYQQPPYFPSQTLGQSQIPGNAPAINPRFAAQYQQMIGMGGVPSGPGNFQPQFSPGGSPSGPGQGQYPT